MVRGRVVSLDDYRRSKNKKRRYETLFTEEGAMDPYCIHCEKELPNKKDRITYTDDFSTFMLCKECNDSMPPSLMICTQCGQDSLNLYQDVSQYICIGCMLENLEAGVEFYWEDNNE